MEINAVCEQCDLKFTVNDTNVDVVTYKKAHKDNAIELFYITSYKCPKCGREHFVQIDNDNTRKLLGYATDNLKQAMKERNKTNSVSKKTKRKLDNSRKKLSEARLELMKMYNETDFKKIDSNELINIKFSL